jgi:hypothetical protein
VIHWPEGRRVELAFSGAPATTHPPGGVSAMRSVLMPARPVLALDRVLPWLLAVSRELFAPAGVVPVAFSRNGRDHDGDGRLDAATGCEFVDDQIRHAE